MTKNDKMVFTVLLAAATAIGTCAYRVVFEGIREGRLGRVDMPKVDLLETRLVSQGLAT